MVDLNNYHKSCEIACSLRMENKPINDISTLLNTLDLNQSIEVSFIYSEYAASFLDSISEVTFLDKAQLNRKFIELLIA